MRGARWEWGGWGAERQRDKGLATDGRGCTQMNQDKKIISPQRRGGFWKNRATSRGSRGGRVEAGVGRAARTGRGSRALRAYPDNTSAHRRVMMARVICRS